ncbi:helix-turn-helix domain-containing protein [Natronobacterium haloterrestre]|uniref:helix-turn-helix domain-containing protein n=1 Tax=Natronobacterium haloterrestre TaxID=148448 RepID=UPI0015A6D4CA|nr:helix-turn-helix domain-containing protein [Halobiforma haloterrestris]
MIAEFSLPVDDFVLGNALQLDEIKRIEFDCKIPARTDSMPYFWVWGSQFDQFETVVDQEQAIDSVVAIDELDGTRLYRATWRARVSYLLEATKRSNGVIRGVAGDTRWEFELLFEQREDLVTFTDYYADTGMELELERLYSLSGTLADHDDLTPAQRETLITAEQKGFYDEPRSITMEELADELGVSLAAVSGRLRRGTSKLIRKTLL